MTYTIHITYSSPCYLNWVLTQFRRHKKQVSVFRPNSCVIELERANQLRRFRYSRVLDNSSTWRRSRRSKSSRGFDTAIKLPVLSVFVRRTAFVSISNIRRGLRIPNNRMLIHLASVSRLLCNSFRNRCVNINMFFSGRGVIPSLSGKRTTHAPSGEHYVNCCTLPHSNTGKTKLTHD